MGSPQLLLTMIASFHQDASGTKHFDESKSDRLEVKSGVKQTSGLIPTLFGTYFVAHLKQRFQKH